MTFKIIISLVISEIPRFSTSTNSDDLSEINEPKIFDDEHAIYL